MAKKYKGRRLSKIHYSTRKNIPSEIVNSSKTYSSDLTNVSQVNFTLTYATFQEIPAMKISFR